MRNYGVDYPGFVNPPDAAYPYSSPKNATTDTAEDGTPVEEKWVGDVWGFFQSVVGKAGITPNGQTDSVSNPQILTALTSITTDWLVGFVLTDSTISSARNLAFIADGSEYNRADYPKLWNKVNGTAMLVSQSLINADSETYAANYGDGNGSTTFTLPNYGLRPHLAAAGAFGSVGTTAKDHIQNITGSFYGRSAISNASLFSNGSGGFYGGNSDYNRLLSEASLSSGSTTDRYSGVYFDASRIARTNTYTEVNTSFLNFYIIHGESV